MNIISFISLLQEHPMLGFLLAIIFFAVMFGIKSGIALLFSRSIEKNQGQQQHTEDS